ncbi:uncharacterized protein LOC135114938 [Scylla paramamosain]|uniref:uncharacterized protein LOC135114938 n=1 Tax=Scylla paramamosain TaxID=85552 RepID=UPI003082B11B
MRVSVALMLMGAVLVANLLTVNAIPSLYRSLSRRSAHSDSNSDSDESPVSNSSDDDSSVVKRSLSRRRGHSDSNSDSDESPVSNSSDDDSSVVKRSLSLLPENLVNYQENNEEVAVVKRSPGHYAQDSGSTSDSSCDD